jgi:hypothetical protein
VLPLWLEKEQLKHSAAKSKTKALKSKRRQGSRLTSVLTHSGLPERMKVSLPYCDTLVFTHTSGIQKDQTWRLTSLFDPDYTNAGHQPLYYDQFISFYHQYIVESVDVEIDISQVNQASPLHAALWVDASASTTPVASASAPAVVRERPGALYVLTSGFDVYKFKKTFVISEELGLSRDAYVNSFNQWTPTGSNPGQNVFLQYCCAPIDNATTITSQISVKLVFNAWFGAQSPTSAS